jgi:hypothetical protein
MGEQWENIIIHELLFYANFKQFEDELKDRLLENDLDIKYPTTTFDEEQGRVYLSCPGTEEQALRRIEVREAIESIHKRAKKRIERLVNALNQLDEDEFIIISEVYIEGEMTEMELIRTMGFQNKNEFHEAKRRALLKIVSFFEVEREENVKLFAAQRKEERKNQVAAWTRQQQERKMNKLKILI